MKILLPVLILLTGVGTGVMVACNSRLKDSLGSPAFTVAVAFAIGSVLLFLVSATGVTGKITLSGAADTPWWAWVGGILSIIAVTVILVANKQGGGGALILAASVIGQQAASLALEHNGWLGTEKAPINGWKIAGFLLLVGGAVLMGKK
ncbi:MAG: DMT family transporter [Akkermansiaceae bacterium]|nr:DMT family transporter [Armatimonadota bacterium]